MRGPGSCEADAQSPRVCDFKGDTETRTEKPLRSLAHPQADRRPATRATRATGPPDARGAGTVAGGSVPAGWRVRADGGAISSLAVGPADPPLLSGSASGGVPTLGTTGTPGSPGPDARGREGGDGALAGQLSARGGRPRPSRGPHAGRQDLLPREWTAHGHLETGRKPRQTQPFAPFLLGVLLRPGGQEAGRRFWKSCRGEKAWDGSAQTQ
uniref:Uncharacterized protein n=1 Tax=Myotis myotis TaxID=51298 RepID=A0A7J7U5B5_MYOMY|nr:hypothetical protein mMyoMyo1_008905 [Myotis myotis]